MSNLVKQHETNLVSEKNQSDVNAILDGVENVPFALSGATTKTILYALFSALAAVELTSALGFYTASLGLGIVAAFVICGIVATLFHGLLHSILSNTAHGIVFKKRSESKAMSTEVIANIVLSVVLLLGASCTVFFVGKKGFAAYRATEFETKMKTATTAAPTAPIITPDMLTSKSGKISVYKLELLGKLEGAKAASTEATTAANTTEKDSYDKTTNTITDIVGASAFVLEMLLALLAFTIATAKKAAVMEEITKRKMTENNEITVNNSEKPTVTVNRNDEIIENRNGLKAKKIVTADTDYTPYMPIKPTDKRVTDNRKEDPVQRPKIGFMAQPISNKYEGICPNCSEKFERKNPKKVYCSTNCKTQFWQQKNGVTIYGEQLNK